MCVQIQIWAKNLRILGLNENPKRVQLDFCCTPIRAHFFVVKCALLSLDEPQNFHVLFFFVEQIWVLLSSFEPIGALCCKWALVVQRVINILFIVLLRPNEPFYSQETFSFVKVNYVLHIVRYYGNLKHGTSWWWNGIPGYISQSNESWNSSWDLRWIL